jgi:hypothetical protein
MFRIGISSKLFFMFIFVSVSVCVYAIRHRNKGVTLSDCFGVVVIALISSIILILMKVV